MAARGKNKHRGESAQARERRLQREARARYEAERARREAARRGRETRRAPIELAGHLGIFVYEREKRERMKESGEDFREQAQKVRDAHAEWLEVRRRLRDRVSEDVWEGILEEIGDTFGLDEDFLAALDESPEEGG